MAMDSPANAPGPGDDDNALGQDADSAPDNGDTDSEDKETAFLPMDFFSKRPEIGHVCSVKVIDVTSDGDVEVEYVDSDKKPMSKGGPKAPWDEDEVSDGGGAGQGY